MQAHLTLRESATVKKTLADVRDTPPPQPDGDTL